MKKIGEPINSMDFCYVINDKKLKGSGLVRGDIVMVAGTLVVPASAKDPYLHRVLVRVILIKENKLLSDITNEEHKLYIVDPRNLEKIVGDKEEWLKTSLRTQFETIL